MNSPLHHLSSSDVICDPFPHVAVSNPLNSHADYAILRDSFPEIPARNTPNTTSRLLVHQWLKMPANQRSQYAAWDAMRIICTGKKFFRDAVQIFKPFIDQWYGVRLRKKLLRMSVGLRRVPSQPGDVLGDFIFVTNNPAAKSGVPIRGAHIDNATELFACLSYFADEEESENGGDLILHGMRKNRTPKFGKKMKGRSVSENQLDPERVKIYPYKSNLFVMFLNTPQSVHSVTARNPAAPIRQYVNASAQLKKPLFPIRSKDS